MKKYTFRYIIVGILLLVCFALVLNGSYIGYTNGKLGMIMILLSLVDLFVIARLCWSGWV